MTLELWQAAEKGRAMADLVTDNTRREVADDWPERAYAVLCRFIETQRGCQPWPAEAATDWCSLFVEAPHDQRAWGSLFSRAGKNGLIHRAGLFPRAKGHGTVAPGWVTA